jgi:hypothetical protein
MREQKTSQDTDLAYRLSCTEVYPHDMDVAAARESFRRFHATVSNVPPQEHPYRFGPAQMLNSLPMGPISTPGLCNITLLTFEGKTFTLMQMEEEADASPNGFYGKGAARRFLDIFEEEFRLLQQECGAQMQSAL